MRFGIISMQVDYLVPSGGHASPDGFDPAGLARLLHAEGFSPIELAGDLGALLPHTFAPETVDRLAALRAELGLSYTVHLPLWSIEPSTFQEPVRRGSVQALVDCIEATRPLEPEVYVLHATGALAAEFYQMRLPEAIKNMLLRQFQGHARRSIAALLAETGLPPRSLAVETIEFPLDLTLELAEEFDLSVCLDTGHVLAGFSGEVALWDALERCLPRLAEVHLHDCPDCVAAGRIGYHEDHRPLGGGDLDVRHLLGRLEAAGFTGPLIFELTLAEALASMETLRRLTEVAQ